MRLTCWTPPPERRPLLGCPLGPSLEGFLARQQEGDALKVSGIRDDSYEREQIQLEELGADHGGRAPGPCARNTELDVAELGQDGALVAAVAPIGHALHGGALEVGIDAGSQAVLDDLDQSPARQRRQSSPQLKPSACMAFIISKAIGKD